MNGLKAGAYSAEVWNSKLQFKTKKKHWMQMQ